MISVSYILPTMNRAKYVDLALDSAKKFITDEDELIVVDGSKNDETEKVVKKYHFLNLIYIRSNDRNEAHASNVGLLRASGEIIKPISDDDFFYPDSLLQAILILKKNQLVDAVQCGGEAYRETNSGLELLFNEKIPRDVTIASDFNGLLRYAPCQLGLIFKRKLLPLLGIFDTSFTATDINIMSRMILLKINFKYLDLCIYRHIQYAHSTELNTVKLDLDRARVFLNTYAFQSALTVNTANLCTALGFTNSTRDQGYVWTIKLLNYLRNSFLGGAIFTCMNFVISFTRDVYIKHSVGSCEPIAAKSKWSGKMW